MGDAVATAMAIDLLVTLRDRIADHDAKKAILDDRRAKFDADNADLVALLKELASEVDAGKDLIRPLAESEYRTTGSKKLWGGIGIREKTTIEYDAAVATEFAREKDMFLTLDAKAFETAAPT